MSKNYKKSFSWHFPAYGWVRHLICNNVIHLIVQGSGSKLAPQLCTGSNSYFGKRFMQVTIHSTPLTTLIKKVVEVQEAICLLEVTTGILENEYLMFYFLSVKK